jgi:hypothetical protein
MPQPPFKHMLFPYGQKILNKPLGCPFQISLIPPAYLFLLLHIQFYLLHFCSDFTEILVKFFFSLLRAFFSSTMLISYINHLSSPSSHLVVYHLLHTLQQSLQSITLCLLSPAVYRRIQSLTLLDVARLSLLPT